MQTRVAGFGVQVPFGDTPSDVHTAVIFAVGTNPVLYTSEEYPSTTQCAWDSHNGAILRSNRCPTGDWKKFEKLKIGSGRCVWKQFLMWCGVGRVYIGIMASAYSEGNILW